MEDKLSVEELEVLAEENVGEVLRRTREYYGKTLEDVERALRIRNSQIGAIERGDVSKLPGSVYAIGFVRSYAEYLELDGAKVVRLFKAQYMGGQSKSSLSFPVPASETKTPALWLVSGAIVLASMLMIAWHYYNKQDRSIVQEVVLLPEHIETHVNEELLIDALDIPLQEAAAYQQIGVVGDEAGAQSAEEPEVENMGGVQQTGIILKIINDSWVEIKNGEGGILVSRVLEKGEEYFVPDNPGLSMSLGNAANVEIIVEGSSLKPLGKDGDVRRGIPLNTTYLKTLDFKEIEVPEITPEFVPINAE
jgi:cytoskeletal protein RodZ